MGVRAGTSCAWSNWNPMESLKAAQGEEPSEIGDVSGPDGRGDGNLRRALVPDRALRWKPEHCLLTTFDPFDRLPLTPSSRRGTL
jgi:hypothetical protein